MLVYRASIAFLLCANASLASPFCDAIENQSPIEGATSCREVAEVGGNSSYQCWWAFDFRAQDAATFFQNGSDEIATCLAGAQITLDQPVNHPDSYILHEFTAEGRNAAISYKDKATLQQSFVFLRISALDSGG